MRLAGLDHKDLATTACKYWCNIYFTVVSHVAYDVTVDEEWLFILQLLLKYDSPVLEDLCFSLLYCLLDYFEMIGLAFFEIVYI